MNPLLKRIILFPFNILYKFFPKLTVKILFYIQNGYKLNLNKPTTYNEKLQWLKFYYRNELMPVCADKYTVRQFVKKRESEEILNELLWEGFNPRDIPFNEMPKEFVIKVTHGSGFNIICKDKNKLDKEKTISQLDKWLKAKFIPAYGEWFYGVIKPRIIIEKLLYDEDNNLPEDYKVFCFNGEPRYVVVDTDRFEGHKRNVYDLNWRLMKGYKLGFPNDEPIEKPECLDEMLSYARNLSKGFPHARIDFYIINKKIYFGEVTFTNGAGFDKITPYSFDVEMGNLINIK